MQVFQKQNIIRENLYSGTFYVVNIWGIAKGRGKLLDLEFFHKAGKRNKRFQQNTLQFHHMTLISVALKSVVMTLLSTLNRYLLTSGVHFMEQIFTYNPMGSHKKICC